MYKLVNGQMVSNTPEEDAELEAFWKDEAKKMAKVQYQEDRREAYPSFADQLDFIYHNGIDKWKTDIIDPIKKKYPKPE